ncbi:MAG: hypothetical protein HQL42_13010 [Alphaproteobacteria bacterium]|nr:hypothetical protein [Alphaproteobacteria bacterium]
MPDSARAALAGLTDWLIAALASAPFVIALFAQLAYHLRESADPRGGPPLWRRMLWAVPTAFVIGQASLSLCTFFDVPQDVAGGLSGIAGWYGLSGLHAMAVRILRARRLIDTDREEC